MEDAERRALTVRVSQAFSPSAPIDKSALFAGRHEQTRDVINAVIQRGQHVIIFGERGVGKTSLATVLFDLLSTVGLKSMDSGTINCDGTMDFSSLWHKIFREISIDKEKTKAGFTSEAIEEKHALDSFLENGVTPDDVRYLLQRYTGPSIIIIDEVDRIKDSQTTTLLADTIKNLSDHSVDTTLILVGVADSVDGLIAEHRSVERALVQVRMPRMSQEELFEIIDKGLDTAQMTIDKNAKQRIARLSQGLPHYTHLLGLHAAQDAIIRGLKRISLEDVQTAIAKALDKAQQSTVSAYHKATISPRENLYKQVLLACALAKTDSLGYFSAADVRTPMTKIMGKSYNIPAFSRHLYDFCDERRGPILHRMGSERRYRYRFINPLMQPFIMMNGVVGKLIPENVLDAS